MYAQLCVRLNEFAPNFEEAGNKTTTFRKLLLHKCHEEFEKRKNANAVLENSEGLSAEEKEHNVITKWKMLGNIKFVGELFKLDMLHEKIIHSCVKELLEKKRNQSTEDVCKSLECLCYFLTTVGVKLDTEKAKGWMDAYFERIEGLCENKELPRRIHFMIRDLVDLRKNKWLPRRSHPESSPRPIYKIHQEAYEESRDPSSQSYSRRSPSNASPPQHNGSYSGPHPPQDFRPHPLHDIGPHPSHDIGPHYLPPQPHGPRPSHEPRPHYYGPLPPHMNAPGPHPPHLIGQSPQQQHMMVQGPHPQHVRPHNVHSIQSPPELHTSSAPSSGPPPQTIQSPLPDTHTSSEKTTEKSKKPRKGSGPKAAESVSLRPSVTFKPGVKLHPPKTSPPLDHKSTSSSVHTAPPRTRDDSSDEDDPRRPPGSSSHHVPPQQSLGPPFPPAPFHPIPPSLGYPPQRFPIMAPPGPMHYGPPFPPGPPLLPMVPYLMPQPQSQYLPHDSFPRGAPRPPGGYPDDPSRGNMYAPPPRPSLGYGVPLWVNTQPHGIRTDPPPHGIRTGQVTDNTEKTGSPVQNVPKGSPRAEVAKMEALKKLTTTEDTEKIVTSAVEHFLKTLDFQVAINDLKVEGINKSTMCALLLTKTLDKSEDERTHISNLLGKLVQANVATSSHLREAFTDVMGSVADYVAVVPQAKVYLAGFMARTVNMGLLKLADILSTFDQGEHHPMALVTLQALNALLGSSVLQQQFQESGVKVSSLLPASLRSHASIIELLDAKCIGFLYPLRKTQSEISGVLSKDPSPASIYKWIKANVPSALHSNDDFIMLLTRCILDHVTHGHTLPVTSDMAQQHTKEQIAIEKESMSSLKVVIQKLVAGNVPLQVCVLYATQVFCNDNNFPKGLMLRMFHYWYNLDVIDEDAFFKWKEDISQEHPGKEKALFQVHQWLVWLSEADEESEEEGKD